MFTIEAFLDALTLQPTGEDRYRPPTSHPSTTLSLGGSSLRRSVMAGLAGQEAKTVKTIHTVFARAASPEAPLDIAVELDARWPLGGEQAP